MQRDRRARENFNGSSSPFDSFDDFGFHASMFGGKDPFDDPFFTRPFGSSFGSNMFHSSVPSSSQHTSRSKHLAIEELDSGAEEMLEDKEENDPTDARWSNRNPIVEHPEDQDNESGRSNNENRNEILYPTSRNRVGGKKPETQSHSFQRVTYGGINGTYYTATTSRQTGSDGVTLEESRQADRTTGQATHRISRGIQDKGHSVTRKLDSDGKVDTMQTLHNLDEDELVNFEQAWRGRDLGYEAPRNSVPGQRTGPLAAWVPDPFKNDGSSFHHTFQNQSSRGKPKKVVRINIE